MIRWWQWVFLLPVLVAPWWSFQISRAVIAMERPAAVQVNQIRVINGVPPHWHACPWSGPARSQFGDSHVEPPYTNEHQEMLLSRCYEDA